MNDRARVPFALVGVLLLVSSATLTATVGTYDPGGPAKVDRAMQGATAETVTALRGAADEAATEAAAAPLTRPADSTAGEAIDASQPFEDALRLRIYLAARDRLEGVAVRRGDVVARASLPPAANTTDGYRRAIEHVQVERTGSDDAALAVEIEGLTLTASRRDRTVATDERNVSFVVANPALLLHDRTERYERRANADVTDDGLAQRLTARLYPIGWARGYAQYGGAPIRNVIGTRHVELATNDALIAEQRSVFGTTDPDSHRGTAAAGRRVAVGDALGGVGGDPGWTDAVLATADRVGPEPPVSDPVGTWDDRSPVATVPVGVNGTADDAYADLVDTDGPDDLAVTIERVHTVEARLDTAVEPGPVEAPEPPDPGPGWEAVDETTVRSVALERTGAPLPGADGWETRGGAVFEATVTATATRSWSDGDETTETEATVERDLRVRVAVRARTEPIDGVPDGDLVGELAPAADRATGRVVGAAGGLEAAARAAALDGPTTTSVSATVEPTVERGRLVADLAERREVVRNVSVAVPAPALGVGRANPPAMLREELSDREADLLGATGPSPAERARRASRVAYLAAVDERLARDEAAHDAATDPVEGAVIEHLGEERLDGALAAHRMAERGQGDDPTDPAGDLTLAVESTPGYLPTKAVRRERMDGEGECTVHPLGTRNVNVFASPHGQVAASIGDRTPVVGTDRVSLATAAQQLAAGDGLPADDRQALRREVARANAHVRCELVAELVDAGVAPAAARAAVARNGTVAQEAMALTNGTTVDRVAASVRGTHRQEDGLRDRLGTALEEALRDDAARPPRPTANEFAQRARRTSREKLEASIASGVAAATQRGKREVLGDRMGSIPAGLPVAPVPGYWIATTNVWYVETRGTHERFVVRADRGGPTGGTTYVRDGGVVELDHRGRGLRLGTAERVSFATETAVVVVVPPGSTGVGDTDGFADERSVGWSD